MNVVGALSWGEGTPSGEKGSPMRKVIERWRGEGHMLRQKKAEQTCCRLGTKMAASPLDCTMACRLSQGQFCFYLLLRTPLPENSFQAMVGNRSKSINPSEQGKSRTLNHSHPEVPGKAGASQKAGLGGDELGTQR